MSKLQLPKVTLLGIDCVNVPRLQLAMDICQEQIEFGETKLLSSIATNDSRWVEINPISSIEAYSEFCVRNLAEYVNTDFVLIVQHDGFILNPKSWSDEFLEYDYIGAPWDIDEDIWFTKFKLPLSLKGERFVGNGGFCIRSKKFLEASAKLARENKFSEYQPEDLVMCILNKPLFENEGIRFASYELAKKFSIEGHNRVYLNQFGFHGFEWTDISKWINENPQYNIKNQYIANK